MMEMNDQNILERPERPSFLKVLCILSWIYTGLSFIVTLGAFFQGPLNEEEMTYQKVELAKSTSEMRDMGMNSLADTFDQVQRMSETTNDHFYISSIITLLVIIIGILGVYFMWAGRKMGFHMYIVYNLLTIGQLYIFISPSDIPTFAVVWNLLFSAVFIFMYSRNLKWMTD
ncbi:MAG: hypothetical protein EP305_04645 [Bacteroidetes bacterium]|nr:MAG: hypothetical protein EP305_04645 [Bacteroidota bacterium]